jgi:hypothetical protein
MAAQPQANPMDDAKRLRADLRLALAQADELLRRAEAVLVRNRKDDEA